MFTGIIECIGSVEQIVQQGTNKTYLVRSALSNKLKVDQSVAHNGVCLTVEAIDGDFHQVTAIEETLNKTTLSHWVVGSKINIERCLEVGGRLDGHFVQGHTDAVATVNKVVEKEGSWEYEIGFDAAFAPLIVEKGSICLDGISLTLFNVEKDRFKVAIIPYTWANTNIGTWQVGSVINIEFDILGKYLLRWNSLKS
jgi:riboflavin synthase